MLNRSSGASNNSHGCTWWQHVGKQSLLSCVVFIAAACSVIPEENDVLSVSPPSTDGIFIDNIVAFETKSDDERVVLELIERNIQGGYERFDFSLLDTALAPGFQRLYLTSEEEAIVESREDYLEARSDWIIVPNPLRSLHHNIQVVDVDEANNKAIVVALTTYQSKYFNPRFLETLSFSKRDDTWLLYRQVMVPLTPSNLEQRDVDIFLVKRSSKSMADGFQDFGRIVIRDGADAPIAWALKRNRKNITGDETEHTVLFVFREPPPAGAIIRVEHQFARPGASGLSPYTFWYTAVESNPFFLIANSTRAGGRGGTITYRVFLDREKVGERSVRIL